MLNKRLLHFYLLSISTEVSLRDDSCLNVVVRQQMLRHFYCMITLLLTLHTATTATLLVYPKEHKQISTINSQQSLQTPRLNLIFDTGTASFHNLVRIVKLLIFDEYQGVDEKNQKL